MLNVMISNYPPVDASIGYIMLVVGCITCTHYFVDYVAIIDLSPIS